MKKIFALFIVIAMIVPVTVYAQQESAKLPSFKVTFNGQSVDSAKRQFPLLVYKDITYIPMTYFDCRFMGLGTKWSDETKTLEIFKTNVTTAWREQTSDTKNTAVNKVSVCDFNIVVNGVENIDNRKEEYPLLLFRNVTYFPLTWRFAAEEFGWEYSFDEENGLVINSDNAHAKRVNLVNSDGQAVADGKNYYYYGVDRNEYAIYRADFNNPENYEIIHNKPHSLFERGGSFMYDDENWYASYTVGGSAVMSSTHYWKINPDGTVLEEAPSNRLYSKHGANIIYAQNDRITLEGESVSPGCPMVFTYTMNGETKTAKLPDENTAVGIVRGGKRIYRVSPDNCVQIYKDKIYYTAYNYENPSDSNLYVIDTETNTTQKLFDDVCGFYVYNGWLNEANSDSTMIIYDNNGALMRYSEFDGKSVKICEAEREDMFLVCASGESNIYTAMQSVAGDRTIVQAFDCYMSGTGSVNATLIDTSVGTNCRKIDELIAVSLTGEDEGGEIRTLVAGKEVYYASADVAYGLTVGGGYLMYNLPGENDHIVVKLFDLK